MFLRNFYFFSKKAFQEWLENKAIYLCESLFIDLTWFFKGSINDEIVNAYDCIRHYEKVAPKFLSSEEREQWYKNQRGEYRAS